MDTKTTTAPEATTYELFVVGPMSSGASVRVHGSKDCRNAKRDARQSDGAYPESHTSVQDLVEEWYGDIIAEYPNEDWTNYVNEVHTCACAPAMPYAEGDEVEAPKAKGTTPAQNGRDARTTVGAWPTAPAALVWDGDTAVGAKFTYRRTRSAAGFQVELRTTVRGKWVSVAGTCSTLHQTEILAGYAEAGATWLTYRKVAGAPFSKLGVPSK